MAEWSIAVDCKSTARKGYEGSNPSLRTMGFVLNFFILIAGIAVGTAVFYFIFRKKTNDSSFSQAFLMLQSQINDFAKNVDQKLDQKMSESTKILQHQFSQSAQIIRDVTERLTKLDETNKQVINFADQLQNLQDILKNPKQRGVLGEYYLKTVLDNVLPPGSFQLQYPFKDGTIVDAVIFVKDKVIPIDSKFSLENYNRILETRDQAEREKLEKVFRQDLKNRIDETSKYIKPEEGTMEFALMFIPSEAIYYDLLINQVGAVKVNTRDLIEYAFKEKRVVIVSPTSFLAYLQTILQGLRAMQIEESAKEIRKRVEDLGKHLASYEEFMQKIGKNLGATVGAFNSASKEFRKIDKDVLKLGGHGTGYQENLLDKPEGDVE